MNTRGSFTDLSAKIVGLLALVSPIRMRILRRVICKERRNTYRQRELRKREVLAGKDIKISRVSKVVTLRDCYVKDR